MNEITARRAIRQFVGNDPERRVLAVKVQTAVAGDEIVTAQVLTAVDAYLEKGGQQLVTYQNPARETKRKVKRAAVAFNNPGKAIDKWVAQKGRQVKRKTKIWARDHLAKPAVAAALRLVGMEMKK